MTKIKFTSINVDGNEVKWELTPQELHDNYFSEDCTLPMLDDKVTECSVADCKIYVDTFSDVVSIFLGIN